MDELLSERVQQAVARAEMRYLVEQQRREQEQLRRLLVEWRYRVLQAQMNPHFLFNALNTVHYYILHNDREALLRFVAQFARLMRNVLQLVERTLVPLRQELETTELYLQLEQARFRHAFDYVLHVEPDVEVDEILCPSLLLQPLVENAIKHGLGPRGGRGTIRVCVRLEGESVLCCIEDDGVGRRQQGAAGEHSGAGLRLTQERLALLSRQLKKPFTLQIVDLTRPDGSPAGTRVEIRLPQELDLSVRAELEFLESTAA
jgi:LytS/YehU family sensor histidine kinase